jgi:guanosine-3',5'-bis(diphosphate) 3'-pyrophosphohydrolase
VITVEEARVRYPELDQSLTILEQADLDQAAVQRGVAAAWRLHAPQVRKSGEPFAIHPIAVAAILAEQRLSTESVLAGLLHDTLEDTTVTRDELLAEWGEHVTSIVDGVTKIVRIAPRGNPRRDKAETYRKLLLAAADDARVLVVKLADRLHNMRTIGALAPARQQAIAQETMDVYAPLAHRLGMNQLKNELQDLAFAVLDPENWEVAGLIQDSVADEIEYLASYEAQIVALLQEHHIAVHTKTRVKHRWSIYQKTLRSGSDAMYDILGIRILVETVEDCYRSLGLVHSILPPIFDRFHDYIAIPKANLYQSIHTTVHTSSGRPLEIQIRTTGHDEVAEHGIAAHWRYKETLSTGGPQQTREWIKETAEHQAHSSLDDVFDALKADTFHEEIYVCSPRGDIYILPEGSCPIDFAYAVHTDLGNECVGAHVSGSLRSLNTPLKNGDVVEIFKRPGNVPSLDWLQWVRTSKARQRIRHWHQSQEEAEYGEIGWKRMIERAQHNHFGPNATRERLAEALVEIGYRDPDDVAIDVVRHPDRLVEIFHRLTRLFAEPEPEPEDVERPRYSTPADPVLVDGIDNIMIRFAQCCSPQPGDSIIGYISMGRGISIHRRACRQIQHIDNDRLVDVTWKEHVQGGQIAITIVAQDRRGILRDIADAVYQSGGEIVHVHLRRTGLLVKGTLVCWTPLAADDAVGRLALVQGVLKASRDENANAIR